MDYQPVNWSQGMFVRPQHFQAAERHLLEATRLSQQWDHTYGYGVHAIEFGDDVAEFELTSCRVRTRQGTLIEINEENRPLPLDVKKALDSSSAVRIFLALPELELGRQLVGKSNETRYTPLKKDVPDEGNPDVRSELAFRQLNTRLVTDEEAAGLQKYELIPIAQVVLSGAGPVVDEMYIPPSLTIDSWESLGRDFVRGVRKIINSRLESLTGYLQDGTGFGYRLTEANHLERLFMTLTLNEAAARLQVIGQGKVHPFTAYLELCGIVGRLAFLGGDRQLPVIPDYDHDDLYRIFSTVRAYIVDALKWLHEQPYEDFPFVGSISGSNRTMTVEGLSDDLFQQGCEWYIGVQSNDELSAGYMARLQSKISGAQRVGQIHLGNIPALSTKQLDPARLARLKGWTFYQLNTNEDEWKYVRRDHSLSMRFYEDQYGRFVKPEFDLNGKDYVHLKNGAEVHFRLFVIPPEDNES